MKDYTCESPAFSESISVVERGDLVNADNNNAAPIQIFQNTLANRKLIEDIENEVASFSQVSTASVAIPSSNWAALDDAGYAADVAVDGVTDETVPMACVVPDSRAAALECGLVTMCESMDGAVRFYAESAAGSDIGVELTLMLSSEGLSAGSGSSGGGGTSTDIGSMTATADEVDEMLVEKLGAAATESGAATMADVVDGRTATDAEVEEMLNERLSD